MSRWPRRRRKTRSDIEHSRWPDLLAAILDGESDLVKVLGPEDGGSVCTDWVGAILSVSGRHGEFPALVDAVEDGLFHAQCRHRLAPLDTAGPEDPEATFCSQWALTAMRRRRAKIDRAEQSGDLRGKFEGLYAAAQQAEQRGDTAAALYYCQTGLALLRKSTVFEVEQPRIERVLKARIQSVLRASLDSKAP